MTLLEDIRAGRRTAADAVEDILAQATTSDLGAWERLDGEAARAAAAAADAAREAGDRRPLLGVPVAVKDVIDVAGLPTAGGANGWRREPAADAAAVHRLRAAGAIALGKAHTNEFAFGIDGRNPHRPPCRNPHDPGRLPGGSSSGPSVAVAAGMAAGALGTDTSGSIRVPAALCGVVGLRPSHGLVPLDGALPLAPSYDVVGPLGPDVAAVAALFGVLAPAAPDGRPLRTLGVVEELFDGPAMQPAVAAALRSALNRLAASAGLDVVPVRIEGLADALAIHSEVQLPEAAESLGSLQGDPGRLAPDVRDRLAAGAAAGPAGRARGLRRRRGLAAAIGAVLERVDALVAPAVPCVAPALDADAVSGRRGPVAVREALLSCVVPFTEHGGPVLALPADAVDGLPVALQVAAAPGHDRALLALAARIEAALGPG